MTAPLVEAVDLTRDFAGGGGRVRALAGVSLTVEKGEFIALTGPSGCGKSTLLNLIGCADTPTSGSLSILGQLVDFGNERILRELRRRSIGYVFQQFHLLPTLSALENVAFTALLNGASHRDATRRATELLTRVGLAERLHHLPSHLSGGEMQRVAICRALAHRPVLLLADEPTGNLDSATGAEVLRLLRECRDDGVALVMATHSADAVAVASRVIQLRDGLRVHAP